MFPLEPLGEEERPDEVAERGDCEREPDDVAGAHDRSAPGGRSVSPGSAISRSQPRTRSVASAKKPIRTSGKRMSRMPPFYAR